MKYFRSNKVKFSYTLIIIFILLIGLISFSFRAPLYRYIVTINLGSTYVNYLNTKALFFTFINSEKIPEVSINMSPNNYVKLNSERSKMVNNYIVNGTQWSGENNYYKAEFDDNHSISKSKVRLFGMNSDHFRNVNSHSFRIEFNGAAGYGDKRQNFLHPRSRDFITDPLLNMIFNKVYDGIKIEYKPFIVKFNKTNFGIFYSEDFFDKYLIEKNKRRESVIFEITNDSLYFNYIGDDNVFESIGNDLSNLYFNNYNDFLNMVDVEKVKAVLKLSLLVNTGHPLSDINLHWYYNPVSNKIEPTIREAWLSKLSEEAFNSFPQNIGLPMENKLLNDILLNVGSDQIIQELISELDSVENIIDNDPEFIQLLKSMVGYSDFISERKKILKENIKFLRGKENNNFFKISNQEETIKIKRDTIITNEFTVSKNQNLQIDKNVIITLDGGYIKVLGGFVAKGNPDKKIIIKGTEKSGTIYFNTNKEITINNVIFENLTNIQSQYDQPASITFYECDNVNINNSIFRSNISGDDFINFFRSNNIKLTNSIFENILNDAIDSDFSDLIISDSYFNNIGNDGIDGSGSNIRISNNNFDSVEDKAISAGEESRIILKDNEFKNSEIAIVSKDGSQIESINSIFINNSLDIAAFIKKNFYDAPQITLENSIINNYLIEKGSEINGIDAIEYTTDVESKLYGNIYGRASN